MSIENLVSDDATVVTDNGFATLGADVVLDSFTTNLSMSNFILTTEYSREVTSTMLYMFDLDNFTTAPTTFTVPYGIKSYFWKHDSNLVVTSSATDSETRSLIDITNPSFTSTHDKTDFRIEFSITGPDFDHDAYILGEQPQHLRVVSFSSGETIRSSELSELVDVLDPFM
jgi:hypothetical protein